MSSRRIFISSVMRDFGAERVAAKDAVMSLRQQPVMAEDFGAQPVSSQVACMEGVRGSAVYVGIFGPRYGFVAQSGFSATEEEFQEARRRGLPILCFEKKGEKESAQAAFLARLKGYEEGYAFAFFETAEELKSKVVQGLFDLIGQPGVATLDAAGAQQHLDQYIWGSRRTQSGTWFSLSIVPARQGESYLSPLALSERETHDRLLQPALFGQTAFFRQDLGVKREEGSESLTFLQEAHHRGVWSTLAVHTDGTLIFGAALPRSEHRGFSLVRSAVIDEEEVESLLAAFLRYANQFYGQLERSAVITKLYVGLSFTALQQKMFGRIPKPEPTGMTMPMHRLADPLCFPRPPHAVSRMDLVDAQRLARDLTGLTARTFRVGNAAYNP